MVIVKGSKDTAATYAQSASTPSDERIKAIGRRIRKVRGATTQKTFAAILGISVNTLGRYERGETEQSAAVLARLVERCGVDGTWLLLGDGETEEPDAPGTPPPRSAAPPRDAPFATANRSSETETRSPIDIALFDDICDALQELCAEHGLDATEVDLPGLAADLYNGVVVSASNPADRRRLIDREIGPVRRHFKRLARR